MLLRILGLQMSMATLILDTHWTWKDGSVVEFTLLPKDLTWFSAPESAVIPALEELMPFLTWRATARTCTPPHSNTEYTELKNKTEAEAGRSL